jgi:hypothetical protein
MKRSSPVVAEDQQIIKVSVVAGHRVASGLNGNPRFPGGTLRMQAPHFARLGLDLGHFHLARLTSALPRSVIGW